MSPQKNRMIGNAPALIAPAGSHFLGAVLAGDGTGARAKEEGTPGSQSVGIEALTVLEDAGLSCSAADRGMLAAWF